MKFNSLFCIFVFINYFECRRNRKRTTDNTIPEVVTDPFSSVSLDKSYNIRISLDNSENDFCVGYFLSEQLKGNGENKYSFCFNCSPQIQDSLLLTTLVEVSSGNYCISYRLFGDWTSQVPARGKKYIESTITTTNNSNSSNHLITIRFDSCITIEQQNAIYGYLKINTEQTKIIIREMKNKLLEYAYSYIGNNNASKSAKLGQANFETEISKVLNNIQNLKTELSNLSKEIPIAENKLLHANNNINALEMNQNVLRNNYEELLNNKQNKENSLSFIKSNTLNLNTKIKQSQTKLSVSESDFTSNLNLLSTFVMGDNSENNIQEAKLAFERKDFDGAKLKLTDIRS